MVINLTLFLIFVIIGMFVLNILTLPNQILYKTPLK